jgi:acyl carrier protein
VTTAAPTVERVLSIVTSVAGPDRCPAGAGPDTPLADGGFWLDSVDLLETVLACEEAFGVVFDSSVDLTDDGLRTVGTLCDLIRTKRAG